ncbi:hypothetical protein [Lysinibacillus sp. SGAir0095]|uniref:hypothetical protein n=1 Tax=Lysinibacillus sp. SGAir0095 TaxID=2070463 RepID=UPI0010CD693A|nr:hypothetical protein [Lysinibacillus sp. SGAir0095]QCR31011.1 hypothetical protein C1N55_02005 [Lysinibacillus sp. SGAir0095]
MFGISNLVSLVMSAFIILPIVIFLREMSYLIVSWLFGVNNPRLTIGSGPRLFKIGIIDIRKYYHVYSWFSYDDLKTDSKLAYILVYASPIFINLSIALLINFLLANGWGEEYKTFWDRFIFYAFYFVLFDIVPMCTVNGKPNNGMIIYELIRYGKRVDFNTESFIPTTSEMEKQHKEYMKKIEEIKKEREQEKNK